eukprot:TRINITY_DN13950_c0_g1_i3.p1 TRINITY_DN13950_c0_g1~~TRINITY_DN13950_c0_g1_i3.p1  ORF type:complete len:271 (-),score=10.95 TRINITY_DN13950_c0_g1_i3:64-876(-)
MSKINSNNLPAPTSPETETNVATLLPTDSQKYNFPVRQHEEIKESDSKINSDVNVDEKSIFMTNLHFKTKNADIEAHFIECGKIIRIIIFKKPYKAMGEILNKMPKFAYIEFEKVESIAKALELHMPLFRCEQIKIQRKRKNIPNFNRPLNMPNHAKNTTDPRFLLDDMMSQTNQFNSTMPLLSSMRNPINTFNNSMNAMGSIRNQRNARSRMNLVSNMENARNMGNDVRHLPYDVKNMQMSRGMNEFVMPPLYKTIQKPKSTSRRNNQS